MRLLLRIRLVAIPDDRYFGVVRLDTCNQIASLRKPVRIIRCRAFQKELLLFRAAVKAAVCIVRINDCRFRCDLPFSDDCCRCAGPTFASPCSPPSCEHLEQGDQVAEKYMTKQHISRVFRHYTQLPPASPATSRLPYYFLLHPAAHSGFR
jgi:hypothetical protein